MSETKESPLHPRNKNKDRYDLDALIKAIPAIEQYVFTNKYKNKTIDFAKPEAVKLLNKALLAHYYGVTNWDFPDENLCPPIPSRADYIHYIADLLAKDNKGEIPTGEAVKGIDVGCGASCIYPLLGNAEYGWSFLASDTDKESIESAEKIVQANALEKKITFKLQLDQTHFFTNVINKDEHYSFSICNPPFHASTYDAKAGTSRKVENLRKTKEVKATRNFSGKMSELVYQGGEFNFVNSMIYDSKAYAQNVTWFTSLISKKGNLPGLYKQLERVGVRKQRTIEMGTRNKITRVLAWQF